MSGLTNGKPYTFTVTATNGAGTGPVSVPSNSVTPFGNPGVPSNVTATPGDTQVTVSFSLPFHQRKRDTKLHGKLES